MRNIKTIALEITILIFILLLGSFLYLYKIDRIPSGIYADEAVTGYNAYSILKTGKDEYGKTFPVAMKFLGSYTPPLYTYITVPIMAALDINIVSTRLLSAISGILGIVVVFLLLKTLKSTESSCAPLTGCLLFAIAPWTVFFSRVGYEMNLAFLIFSLSALLIWLGIKKPVFLTLGLSSLSLATYADYTQWLLAPLFLVGLTIFFKREIFVRKNVGYLLTGAALGFLIQIPHLIILTTPAFLIKTNQFYTATIIAQAERTSNLLPMFIAIPLAFLGEFLSKFFTFFSPRSLFFLPDPDPQRSLPELSVFYQWMIIPYLVGLYFLFKERAKPAFKFLLLLAIITPIPAALTRDPFHVQRALPLLLPLILIITIGVDKLIYKRHALIWLPVFLLLIISSLLLLWRSYFLFLPQERARVWAYGFSELAEQIREHPNEKFVIDQRDKMKPENLAYIQLAFFLKYPPEKLQEVVSPTIKENYYMNTSFIYQYHFGNIETRAIYWKEDECEEQILAGDEISISKEQIEEHFLTKIFEIRDPIDQIIFRGFRTNPKEKFKKIINTDWYCNLKNKK